MILTSQGEVIYWKYFEISTKWLRLPNPISHRCSFMILDILRILMILPFILMCCLTISDIKTTFLTETIIRLKLSRQTDVINYLIRVWGLSAKASKEVFHQQLID